MLETSVLSLNLQFTLILIKALVSIRSVFMLRPTVYADEGSVFVDCHILFANFTMAERVSVFPWYVSL